MRAKAGLQRSVLIFLIGLSAVLLFVSIGWADHIANPDYVLEEMKGIVNNKTPLLLKYARSLFKALATISIGISLSGLLLSGESNLGSVAAILVKWIAYYSFFMWVLGGEVFFIPHVITASFEAAAKEIAGSQVRPGDILIQGIQIYAKLIKAADILGWGEYIVAGLSGIVIILVFGILAATLAVALVEMYLVICGGCILLGFAGIDYTRDIAVSYLKYAVSVGVKILVIALIAAVAQEMSANWAEKLVTIGEGEFFSVLGYLIGGSVTLLLSAQMIPGIAQGMISGASVSSGGALKAAAAAAMAPATMAASGGKSAAKAVSGGQSVARGVSNTAGVMKSAAAGGAGTLRGAIASGMKAGMQARAGGASRIKAIAKGLGTAAGSKPFETMGAGGKYIKDSAVFGAGSRQAQAHLEKGSGGGNGNGASNYVDPPK